MATDEERSAFVERFGGALTSAGIARMPARIFAALLVDDDGRMTAAELAGSLEVSPASVSGAVGYLDGVGMVRRERVPGSRADVFVVDDDAWHQTLLSAGAIYAPLQAALRRSVDALGTDDPAVRRLRLSLAFLDFVVEEMDGMRERWDARVRELGI